MTSSLNLLDLPDCHRCPLHSAEENVVVGEGAIPAQIMLVSGGVESREEELMVEPHTGAKKRYLHKLLSDAGIIPESIRLTLSVKCLGDGTAKNRTTCSEWLPVEIAECRPKVVVTLGSIPTTLLLRRYKVKAPPRLKDALGEPIRIESFVVMPWHSMQTMWTSGKELQRQTIEFFRKVRQYVDAN